METKVDTLRILNLIFNITTLNFTFSVVDTKSEHYTNGKFLHLV